MVPNLIPAGWFSWSAWNDFPGFRGAGFPLLAASFLIRCGAVFVIPFLACAGSFPDHVLTHFLVVGSFSGTCVFEVLFGFVSRLCFTVLSSCIFTCLNMLVNLLPGSLFTQLFRAALLRSPGAVATVHGEG